MRYQVTQTTRSLATDVVHLVHETRAWLGMIPDAACDEWDNMRNRFPTEDDLRQGFVSQSEPELKDLRSRLWRFQEMLSIVRPEFHPTVLVPAGFLRTPSNGRFVQRHEGPEARAA